MAIQILRGSRSYDPAASTEVLLDGQLFYSKATHSLYIGDGTTELRSLLPINYLEEIGSLENTSWEAIEKISKSGRAGEYFNVGDEKTITLTTGESVTLQILGFNHDDKADGSGKAGITFGMKNLLATKYAMISDSLSTIKGWKNSDMRSSTMATLLSKLPSDLRSVIKPVSKTSLAGTTTTKPSTSIDTTTDSIWLLAVAEIASATALENSTSSKFTTYASAYESEGSQYELFKNLIGDADIYVPQSALIKYLSNGSGSANIWWLRSASPTESSAFHYVTTTGACASSSGTYSYGVCFGFCV